MTDEEAMWTLRTLWLRGEADGPRSGLSDKEREAIRFAFVSVSVEVARRQMRPLLDALKEAGD